MAKPENSRANQTKENKYKQPEPVLKAEKAADYVPTLNEVPKQNNPV